jgi:hypothetical protein
MLTEAPAEAVKVAANADTLVPKGRLTAMVLALSSIVPVAAGLAKEKAVIALSLERGGSVACWQEARRRQRASAKAKDAAIECCGPFVMRYSLAIPRMISSAAE